MTHPARILSFFTLSFLVGVFIGSWIIFPVAIAGVLAIAGLAILAIGPRALLVAIVLVGLAVGVFVMYQHPPPDRYRTVQDHDGAMYSKIYVVRDWFLHGLKAVIPQPQAAFVAGILIGARSELPKSIVKEFQQTGTSHIIAVSGYNITIVAKWLLALLLTVLSRRQAFWATVAGLLIFMILTGAQASVVRATIMGISVLLANQVGRLPTPMHTLLIACGIMVALDPSILRYDIGFQLSFLATIGILKVAPLLENIMPWTRRFKVWGEVFVLTIAANVCVLPLLLYYFGTLSFATLPVNMIILPLIPATMLMGFIAGMLHMVPILGDFVGYLAGLLSSAILAVIHFFARLPGATIQVPVGIGTVALMYGCLGLLIWKLHRYDLEQNT